MVYMNVCVIGIILNEYMEMIDAGFCKGKCLVYVYVVITMDVCVLASCTCMFTVSRRKRGVFKTNGCGFGFPSLHPVEAVFQIAGSDIDLNQQLHSC